MRPEAFRIEYRARDGAAHDNAVVGTGSDWTARPDEDEAAARIDRERAPRYCSGQVKRAAIRAGPKNVSELIVEGPD